MYGLLVTRKPYLTPFNIYVLLGSSMGSSCSHASGMRHPPVMPCCPFIRFLEPPCQSLPHGGICIAPQICTPPVQQTFCRKSCSAWSASPVSIYAWSLQPHVLGCPLARGASSLAGMPGHPTQNHAVPVVPGIVCRTGECSTTRNGLPDRTS